MMHTKRWSSFLDPSSLIFRTVTPSSYPLDVQLNEESDQNSSGYGSSSDANDPPLRFIIIRHGERIDVVYGAGWTQRAFNSSGQYHPFDSNLPPTLPFRTNWQDYDIDTPLTVKGLSQSWNVGHVLARYNLPVTACYSSPAFRSIQTADRILEGMGRKGLIPIRLELGLFECSSWYARSPIRFMSDPELLNAGFQIDMHYRSQIGHLKGMENEYQYYDRSKETMKKIIRLHQKTGGTILLVAHAPSLEVLTRHLMNGQPRPERLAELSGKVDFCSMTIVEKMASSKPWEFRYSLDSQSPANIWQQQVQQPKAVIEPAIPVTYQPPSTFSKYLNSNVTSSIPIQFHPSQESYPPYFVI